MNTAPIRDAVLGVIADDYTGATDVASMLVRAGLRTVQWLGVPQGPVPADQQADALVVALKSRTAPLDQAVAQSLATLRWLQQAGARRFYFKVCSTFDSTPAGNIGPVAEALLAALGSRFTIVCPAFPENGRSVYRGHLFVGDQLLSDSGMREHPLTPMTDSNLVHVLQAQSRQRVGLLGHDDVAAGVEAARQRIKALQTEGVVMAIADAVSNAQLRTLAAATADMPLLVAGSGLALGLPDLYAGRGWVQLGRDAARLDAQTGTAAVLAGSCSLATQGQVAAWRAAGRPARAIDARALAAGKPVVADALAWARDPLAAGPVLLHATLAPDELKAVQADLGVAEAGALVEQALATIAQGLLKLGVQRLVVAGGETSGAVVQALGVQRLRIGAAICPGVPWTQAGGRPLWLALKSGNFGGPCFFEEALAAGAA
jgi:uncharacterized protein YgbK (DUF1537 family)